MLTIFHTYIVRRFLAGVVSTFVFILGLGCGGDPTSVVRVPTCGEAFGGYYDAGCSFVDSSGDSVDLRVMTTLCTAARAAADAWGGDCPDRMDAYLVCLSRVSYPDQCRYCDDELEFSQECEV